MQCSYIVPVFQLDTPSKALNKTLILCVIKPVNKIIYWIWSFLMIDSEESKFTKINCMCNNPKIQVHNNYNEKKLWIGMDPSNLNTTMQCEPYYYHNIKDVRTGFSKVKYLTIIERRIGLWQIILCTAFSYLMTFNALYGWFTLKWMPFALNIAGNTLQQKRPSFQASAEMSLLTDVDKMVRRLTVPRWNAWRSKENL